MAIPLLVPPPVEPPAAVLAVEVDPGARPVEAPALEEPEVPLVPEDEDAEEEEAPDDPLDVPAPEAAAQPAQSTMKPNTVRFRIWFPFLSGGPVLSTPAGAEVRKGARSLVALLTRTLPWRSGGSIAW